MANLLIRNLDDEVVRQLKAAAKAHGRSLQAEIHDALERAGTRSLAETRRVSARWLRRLRERNLPDSTDLYTRRQEHQVSVFVVDASVVLKWFLPEIHSDAARRLLEAAHHYVAPDLLFPEVGNALWKIVRRGHLSADEGQRLIGDIVSVAVESVPTRGLIW